MSLLFSQRPDLAQLWTLAQPQVPENQVSCCGHQPWLSPSSHIQAGVEPGPSHETVWRAQTDKVPMPLTHCPRGLRRLQRMVRSPGRKRKRRENAPGSSLSTRGQPRVSLSWRQIMVVAIYLGGSSLLGLGSSIQGCFEVNSQTTWSSRVHLPFIQFLFRGKGGTE